jgi:uncharacterized protein (TIGR02453 family)
MIQKNTLDFLKKLKKNNNRDWFQKNKALYESAWEDTGKLAASLIERFKAMQPGLAGLEPKDCLFRIYRDVRFSKDKSPYKTNFGIYVVEGGKQSGKAGFYLQIEPGNSFLAGGNWMPPSPVLKSIRQEIDYNLDEFNKILNGKSFKKYFGELSDTRLKTTPKGYQADHPGIDHLRQTSYIVTTPVDDSTLLSKGLLKFCADRYRDMKPLIDFLNRAQE